MPRPAGRDRLEPAEDGAVVLLSLRPKGWSGRPEVPQRAPVLPGTAVRWDGELWEVLSVEPRAGGGWRHLLTPWDERFLVRSVVEYGDGGAPAAEEAAPAEETPVAPPERPVPVAPLPSGGSASAPPPRAPVPARPAAAPAAPRASASRVAPAAPLLPPPTAAGVAGAWRSLSPAVRALLLGFVPSVLLGWFFPFRVLGEGISFFVHELGHTFVAWFFGCTALPAIVLTVVFSQNRAVAAIVLGALVFLAWRYRHARGWNVLFAAVALVYPFVAFTKAHVTAFDLGGHLAEAGFAAWAFRRAVRSERPGWERATWAFFAFYLVARNVKLFGGVVLSPEVRTDYLTVAIAGQNDLVKVAATTGLPLTTLAALVALLFLVVPVVSLALAFRAPAEEEAAAV